MQVDDKYQYSKENRDNTLHGWISSNPGTGFWMITPSVEFRSAGPFKQELTSHAGPITLSVCLQNFNSSSFICYFLELVNCIYVNYFLSL